MANIVASTISVGVNYMPAGDFPMTASINTNQFYGYSTGGTGSGNYIITNPGPVFNTKQEYYDALAREVEKLWVNFDQTKCKDLREVVTAECKKILNENLTLTEGPLGPVYRLKPEAHKRVAEYLDKLVNELLLNHVMEMLKAKAEELKKIAEECKSATPSDQPKPTVPSQIPSPQGQFVWVPAGQMVDPNSVYPMNREIHYGGQYTTTGGGGGDLTGGSGGVVWTSTGAITVSAH